MANMKTKLIANMLKSLVAGGHITKEEATKSMKNIAESLKTNPVFLW